MCLALFFFPKGSKLFLIWPNTSENILVLCSPRTFFFLASVWTGCSLGPGACHHLWLMPWDLSFILPFCWIPSFALSFSSPSLSFWLLLQERRYRTGKFLSLACLEIYLILLLHSTDSTSGNRILGWKSFSLRIL